MKRIVVVAVMIALLTLAACQRGAPGASTGTPNPPFLGEVPQDVYIFQGEPGVYGGQIVLELKNDPRSFNIIRASDENTAFLLQYHVNRWLIDYRNGDNPPDYDSGLCTKWEPSSDAKQWTFYLRRGIRWSDGEPFNADDLLFTYALMLDEKIECPAREVFREGTDAAGHAIYPELEKIDDHTVRFTLHNGNAMFLDQMVNFAPIPKHKWEKVWREGKFNKAMELGDNLDDVVSLGPFRLKEYVSGQRVVLERNPYFWKVDKKGQRLPYLDRIVFVTAKDFNTVQAKFQAGELDIMSRVRAEDYAQVKKMESPEIVVQDIGTVLDTQWLVLNQNNSINRATGKPFVEPWKQRLFRDQKFRQAISYAIDREALVNTVYVGRAVPLFAFVTPADKYWYTEDVMKYPYDKERARQMLAELGLKDTNGDGTLEDSENHSLEFTIYTNSENSQRIRAVAFITKNLQDIGIKTSIATVPLGTVTEMQQSIFNFDAMVLGWAAAVPPGPTNAKNIMLSAGLNHACFASQPQPSTEWEAQIDKLVHEIDSSLDPAVRKQKYAEIQRIWSEQLPEINLVAQKEAIAYKNIFGNLLPSPLPPRVTWNVEEIYIKQK
jgi:peptide/nickel transport system substrate-binding protein